MVASAQGLDVALYQGAFDWPAAVARIPGLSFGMYKLSEALNPIDPQARHNHDAILAAGLFRGAYHFLDPAVGGEQQAEHYMQLLTDLGYGPEHIIALDNETAHSYVNGQTYSPAEVSACARAFMAEIGLLAPRNPVLVYTFINFARDGYCAGLEEYPLWLAYPAASAPAAPMPWTNWTFWQWGQRNGDDADAFNGTVAELRAWVASFNPPPSGPGRIVCGGAETMAALANQYGCTVTDLIRATTQHTSSYGPGQRWLLDHLSDVKPVQGTQLWHP